MASRKKSESEFMMKFMLSKLEAVDRKIDRMGEKMELIHVETAKNTEQITIHMKRADALEKIVHELRNPLAVFWSWIITGASFIFKWMK